MFATTAVKPSSVRVRPSARIHYIGRPGPSSPIRPASAAYSTKPGILVTFVGMVKAATVAGFGATASPAPAK